MKQTCCHIGCDKDAEFMITGERGVGYDDTYMCADHKDEHIGDSDSVKKYKQMADIARLVTQTL